MKWSSFLFPLGFLASVSLIAEILVKSAVIPNYLLPTPSEVLMTLVIDRADFQKALLETLMTSVAGWTLANILGVSLASLMTLSKVIEKTLFPIANFFQTVPLIAMAPILVIWFGFGAPTVIVSALIVSVFPVIANSFSGFTQIESTYLDLFKLSRASSWKEFIYLRFPQALPQTLVGSRIAIGLSLIGSIVGEFIASGGLGGIIDSARTQQRLDRVFAAVLTTSFLGILLVLLFDLITRKMFKKWQVYREN